MWYGRESKRVRYLSPWAGSERSAGRVPVRSREVELHSLLHGELEVVKWVALHPTSARQGRSTPRELKARIETVYVGSAWVVGNLAWDIDSQNNLNGMTFPT